MTIELDKNSERPVYSPVCGFCRHRAAYVSQAERQTCAAFPAGIPDEIWFGGNKHLTSYPGDQGIQFEAREGVLPEVLRQAGLPAGD